MRLIGFLIAFSCCIAQLSAQTTISSDPFGDVDTTIKRGWEVCGNFGVFKASPNQASFYNGRDSNVNNVNYVFSNYYWRQDIENQLIQYVNRDSFAIASFPSKMQYDGAMYVGFSARFNYSRALSLNFHFNFARLNLKDVLSLQVFPALPGEVESYVQCGLFGQESRSNIDVGLMYAFEAEKDFSPIAEIGINLNSTVVKYSKLQVYDLTFNLVDVYGTPYVPNSPMTEYPIKQGGLGFGLYSSAGIRYTMSHQFSMELVGFAYYSKVNLEGYTGFGLHYGAMIRLIISPYFINPI